MPLPRRPIGAGGVVLSPMREPEPAGRSKRRLRPPPRRPDEPAAAHANDLVDARNGTMVQAADMLIEESQRLLQEEEYDKALATLDQASVVAPHDGSIHLMKALSRCKAAMAEIEQLQLLSGPEWGEFALHSRRVAVDAGIQLELDAAEAKRGMGGGTASSSVEEAERFLRLRSHARHLAAKTARMVESHNAQLGSELRPYEMAGLQHVERLAVQLGSGDPGARQLAVQQLAELLRSGGDDGFGGGSGGRTQRVADCQSFVRSAHAEGLRLTVGMLSSTLEQEQWVGACVLDTVLEADDTAHEAFVALGGLQALVSALAGALTPPEVHVLALRAMQHICASGLLGLDAGSVAGVAQVRAVIESLCIQLPWHGDSIIVCGGRGGAGVPSGRGAAAGAADPHHRLAGCAGGCCRHCHRAGGQGYQRAGPAVRCRGGRRPG
jgi:hypothetical protein|eukprot:COSAG01_NODE_290_length_19382_cov_22.903801_9_plen_438_part_00